MLHCTLLPLFLENKRSVGAGRKLLSRMGWSSPQHQPEKSSFPLPSPSQELGRSWIPRVLSRGLGQGHALDGRKQRSKIYTSKGPLMSSLYRNLFRIQLLFWHCGKNSRIKRWISSSYGWTEINLKRTKKRHFSKLWDFLQDPKLITQTKGMLLSKDASEFWINVIKFF